MWLVKSYSVEKQLFKLFKLSCCFDNNLHGQVCLFLFVHLSWHPFSKMSTLFVQYTRHFTKKNYRSNFALVISSSLHLYLTTSQGLLSYVFAGWRQILDSHSIFAAWRARSSKRHWWFNAAFKRDWVRCRGCFIRSPSGWHGEVVSETFLCRATFVRCQSIPPITSQAGSDPVFWLIKLAKTGPTYDEWFGISCFITFAVVVYVD